MPHIHTKVGEHDHTVSAYVFRTDFAEPKIMLHLHRKLHSYMQFGGHIELNEHPTEALAHELLEESGYVLEQMRILQPKDRIEKLTLSVVHPQPVVHSTHSLGKEHFHTDSAYALITDQSPQASSADDESKDIKLFTRSELVALSNDKIVENVREIALFIFDECLDTWEKIPATSFL
jgi:8-oxo-dGTP pyrophosphatase MutT (NUDIX family)